MKLPPGYVAGVGVHKASGFGGFGQRMLERMGWNKGQGLGKDKSGMKEALDVKEKKDVLGVGANVSWNWDRKYWEDAYNSAIQAINHDTSSSGGSSSSSDSEQSGSKRRRSSSSSSSSSSDSDCGPGRGRGGKRAKASPAARNANGKPAAVVNRDGTFASASADELKIAAELAKDPWGRWGGRAGKMARIRAQEAEEAARARARLGLPPLPVPAAAAQQAEGSSDSSSSSDDSSGDEGSPGTSGRGHGAKGTGSKKGKEKEKTKGKQRREKDGRINGAADAGDGQAGPGPAEKPKRIVVVLGGAAADAARAKMFASFKRTPMEGWWGAKMFVSAGLLESLEDEAAGDRRLEEAAEAAGARLPAGPGVAATGRKGFNEDDQEALYKRAHDFQRVGRRGLGKAEIKVGGAKWEGTKKTFGEDEEEGEEEEEEEEQQQGQGSGRADGATKKEQQQQTVAEAHEGDEGEGKRKKGKKKGGKGSSEEHKVASKADKKRRRKAQEEEEQQQQQQQEEADGQTKKKGKKTRRKERGGAEAALKAEAEDGAPGEVPAAAKPKWAKLIRAVLEKSSERRTKLRKVVSELLAHVEEQHRSHHRSHHKHRTGSKGEPDGAGPEVPPSPWDEASVRAAVERKVRKDPRMSMDGKFVQLVE